MSDAYKPRIRLGMVGGGRDAFIGAVHRYAARLDDRFELVAGALSSSAEKSRASGADLGLAPDRCYGDFTEMAKREARLKNGIEAVAIVTPNHMHAPAAREFLKRGIHVICDKPLTSTLKDARALAKLAEKSDALFILTHNYTAYPMIRQARDMIASGELGEVRVIQAQYAQDWLSADIESGGQKQAGWRTDPAKSGGGGAIGDIGTHAFNLAGFVTGQNPTALMADLHSFVSGRRLDDNAHIMMRYDSGARAMLWASQVAPGNENNLVLRIYGDKAGLEWHQENPNQLWFTRLGEAKQLITRGGAAANAAAAAVSRIPGGHPEGYLEGFATIYSEAAAAIEAHRTGQPQPAEIAPQGIAEGLRGMEFIDACLRSHAKQGWVNF